MEYLENGNPTPAFWQAWNQNKAGMKKAGWKVTKSQEGKWLVTAPAKAGENGAVLYSVILYQMLPSGGIGLVVTMTGVSSQEAFAEVDHLDSQGSTAYVTTATESHKEGHIIKTLRPTQANLQKAGLEPC